MANNVFPPVETAYPIDNAHVNSFEAYQTQYAESVQDPEGVLGKYCGTVDMVSEMGYGSRLRFC